MDGCDGGWRVDGCGGGRVKGTWMAVWRKGRGWVAAVEGRWRVGGCGGGWMVDGCGGGWIGSWRGVGDCGEGWWLWCRKGGRGRGRVVVVEGGGCGGRWVEGGWLGGGWMDVMECGCGGEWVAVDGRPWWKVGGREGGWG